MHLLLENPMVQHYHGSRLWRIPPLQVASTPSHVLSLATASEAAVPAAAPYVVHLVTSEAVNCPDWNTVSEGVLAHIRHHDPAAALAHSFQTGRDLSTGVWWMKLNVLSAWNPPLVGAAAAVIGTG